MSRTNITKTLRNITWKANVGAKFEAECFIGCGTIISVFDFEVGHVQAVAEGGSNEPENLKPICGTCNKVSGTMNMIDFIKKSGFNPAWLRTAVFTERYNTGPVVLFSISEQMPGIDQIPHIEKIGHTSMITGWYYLVDSPIDVGLPHHINLPSDTLVGGTPIHDVDFTTIGKIPLSINIIKKCAASERDIMRILHMLDFKLDGIDFYKMIFRIEVIFEDYTDAWKLIIQDQDVFDKAERKHIASNNASKFDDVVANFMIEHKINIHY
jgi:hypothetical protein